MCRIMGKIAHRSENDGSEELSTAAEKFHLSNGKSLRQASSERMVALVFLRHFGCTFTRQILRRLEELQSAAQTHQAELVLVHMLKSGGEIRYLSGHDDVARIADPDCELYHAFGLGNGSLIALFGPRVWWLGTLSIFKGCGVGHLAGNGLQMPGAFLFHNGQIIAAQRAKSASELPDIFALFSEIRSPGEVLSDA